MNGTTIAVLGGSFDPPHEGHVALARYALSRPEIGRVLVAPAYRHAFGKQLSPFDHRVHMCELAFRELEGVEVSTLERALGGISYTIDLLEALKRLHPEAPLALLIGADLARELPRWHRSAEVLALAPPLVVGRSGFSREAVTAGAPDLPEISSSEIRARLARGLDASDLVPAKVLAYVREHGLYTERT